MAWLDTWVKRREITVSNTNIDSDLTHFPLNLFLNTTAGTGSTDISSIFDEVGANYKKIAITKSDGTTQIYVEIEKWDSGTEDAVIRVSKSDLTFSSSGTTTLYIYYDNTQADNTTWVGDVGSRTEVYDSSFEGSWTLKETSGTRTDSTSNSNDLNDNNTVTSATGQINGAADFTAANSEYLSRADNASLSITGDITYSFWINADALPSVAGNTYMLATKWDLNNARSWAFRINTVDKLQFIGSDDGTTAGTNILSDSAAIVSGDVGNWVHYAIEIDASVPSALMFKNGASVANTAASSSATSWQDNSSSFAINAEFNSGTAQNFFSASIDDARLSSVCRGSAWAKAEYHSGTDNIVSYGTEELMPSAFIPRIIMS